MLKSLGYKRWIVEIIVNLMLFVIKLNRCYMVRDRGLV